MDTNETSETNAILPKLPSSSSDTPNTTHHPMLVSPYLFNTTTNNNNDTTTHPNFHVQFPLCLVHIGKAAGSSVSCGLGLTYADCEGMPRDKLPHTNFFHMRRNQCASTKPKTYLVTLRNPLTRLSSWFDFEKDILPIRRNKQEEAQLKRKRGMLFTDCYSTFHDFCTIGLQPLNANININATTTANTTTATVLVANSKSMDMTCPERAWAAALGVRAFSYHEWYNYEHYWNGMQRMMLMKQHDNHDSIDQSSSNSSSNKAYSLHVLRTEHLLQDWATVSTERLFRPVNRRRSLSPNHNNTTTTTTTASRMSLFSTPMLANLCRALCPEIQMYKQLVQEADNLNEAQRQESIGEVQALCPMEPPLVREGGCPDIPTFPPLKVPRRQYQTETKQRLFQIK
jgi:hypothetical protein